MTEFVQPLALREMARMITTPAPQPPRRIPVLHWHIDEATQRPVCQWKLASKSVAIN